LIQPQVRPAADPGKPGQAADHGDHDHDQDGEEYWHSPPPRRAFRLLPPGFRAWTLQGSGDQPGVSPGAVADPAEQRIGLPGQRPDDDAILRYAKRWGVLGVDPHMMPPRWIPAYHPPHVDAAGNIIPDRAFLIDPRTEPLELWRHFSQRALAVFNIGANLAQDKQGSPTDWKVLNVPWEKMRGRDLINPLFHQRGLEQDKRLQTYLLFGPPYSADWDLTTERSWLTRELTFWLEIAKPGFSLNEETFRLEVDHGGCVLGVIALQLAMHVSGTGHMFLCSSCKKYYQREKERTPKPGQANYCRACRSKGIAQREANTRTREKKAEARRMRAAGLSDREVSEKLGVKIQTIRGWLRKGK
jgi:hypothetical protein